MPPQQHGHVHHLTPSCVPSMRTPCPPIRRVTKGCLPPLEAMTCGCPGRDERSARLAPRSWRSGAALVTGMDDVDGLAGLLIRLASDTALRRDLWNADARMRPASPEVHRSAPARSVQEAGAQAPGPARARVRAHRMAPRALSGRSPAGSVRPTLRARPEPGTFSTADPHPAAWASPPWLFDLGIAKVPLRSIAIGF